MSEDRTMLDPEAAPPQPGTVDDARTREMAAVGAPPAPPPFAFGGGEATQQAITVVCAVCQTPNQPGERWCQDCGFMLGSTPGEVVEAVDPSTVPHLAAADGIRTFSLRQGANTVGRENADVLLPDPQVSRLHARLALETGGLFLEDLGSTNGSYLQGRKIGPGERIPLYDGDEIRFGGSSLRVNVPGGAPRPQEVSPAAPDSASAAVVEPAADRGPALARLVDEQGKEWPLYEGANTVGRRRENDICITDDPFASGKHAEIVCESHEVRLVDIGSTNGTFIEGERLGTGSPRVLSDGAEMQFGKSRWRLRVEPERPLELADLPETPLTDASGELDVTTDSELATQPSEETADEAPPRPEQ